LSSIAGCAGATPRLCRYLDYGELAILSASPNGFFGWTNSGGWLKPGP